MKATCPLCSTRKARRACPATNGEICAVCCGTKRLVEIACPPDCPYLTSARAHPPAVVQRQRERDVEFVLPYIADLSEPQYRVLLFAEAIVLEQDLAIVPRLHDTDVAEAVAAVAATLETSRAGIIYQHQASSIPAQRLAEGLTAALNAISKEAGANAARLERDAAVGLRRLEQMASNAAQALPDATEAERSWVALARRMKDRVGQVADRQERQATPAEPRIILP